VYFEWSHPRLDVVSQLEIVASHDFRRYLNFDSDSHPRPSAVVAHPTGDAVVALVELKQEPAIDLISMHLDH